MLWQLWAAGPVALLGGVGEDVGVEVSLAVAAVAGGGVAVAAEEDVAEEVGAAVVVDQIRFYHPTVGMYSY